MSSYAIEMDRDTGMIVCRILAFIPESQLGVFVDEYRSTIEKASRRGRGLRILFDNRLGHVLPPAAAGRLVDATRAMYAPDDRTAVLVSGSLNRLQAKRVMSAGTMIFEDEATALEWLRS